MGLLVAFAIGIFAIILIGLGDKSYPRKPALIALGAMMIVFMGFCIGITFTLKDTVLEREKIVTAKNTEAYELVPFEFATSGKEFELSENANSYYIHVFESQYIHFYYKTKQNGVNGYSPETIFSNNVFITDNYEGTPMILKITTTEEFPMDGFEKWWLGKDIHTLQPQEIVRYEIYVPEGAIIETNP